MHIVLVSACEKRALKKTRAVLDSYAIRTGVRSWTTPITMEGLQELRAALKRCATRQTAVACYRNDGRRAMKLLWIVGSKRPFGPEGHFPCGTIHRRDIKSDLPNWVSIAARIAGAGGLGHDPGKSPLSFQDMLEASVRKQDFDYDRYSVRHEWISMRLIQKMRKGISLEDAWKELTCPAEIKRWHLNKGIAGPFDVLDFVIATHHRLFGPVDKGGFPPDRERHIRSKNPLIESAKLLPSWWQDSLAKALDRIGKHANDAGSDMPEGYWRGIAILARIALILADHSVSAVGSDEERRYDLPAQGLFANTGKNSKGRFFNQPLSWHLREAGHEAPRNVYRLATLRLPCLSPEAVEQILVPSDRSSRFAWQNRAFQKLQDLRRQSDRPVLVLNIAGTGSGKTRMNAKCACILAPEGRQRFAVALNQRSLTLQTGDALSQQLGIGRDELAVVIGDQISAKLHEAAKFDSDSDEREVTYRSDTDLTGEQFGDVLPVWMNKLCKKKPFLSRILGAPVLASTVDFLVSAGELNRQGNHASAFLRLLDSDLILDEIDSYDPKAMAAILRVVQMVGLCGRNLICSSATLPYPLAKAVHSAYQSGIRMWAGLNGYSNEFHTAIIDDLALPTITTSETFENDYRQHVAAMLEKMGKTVCRLPVLQPVREQSPEAWLDAVLEAVQRMHDLNAWGFGTTDKCVSFGLVRVANIGTAHKVAAFLAEQLPQARVAAYHSQDFVIQRFLKEQRLDYLLNRKKGNEYILADPEISGIVAHAEHQNIPFIVVATPVEEIGRDHDFDWAVVEPSSSQSIVQTAGRVNRHRVIPVAQPNVAILQYNFRWAKGQKICFRWPGLQLKEDQYGDHDLAALLNWDALQQGLDARLRFDGHPFARQDDKNIEEALRTPLKGLCDLCNENATWMTEGFYRAYPLRSGQAKDTWRLIFDEEGNEIFERLEVTKGYQTEFVVRDGWITSEKKHRNAWLCWSPEELREKCRALGIEEREGLRFEMVNYEKNKADHEKPQRIVFDRSFGFRSDRQK